jgi:hypothetical protein
MIAFLSAIPWPTSIQHVQQASIPTEPEAIAVYVLLLIGGWAVWQGNRGPAPATGDDEAPSSGDAEDGASTSTSQRPKPRRSERRGKNKAKRRRQGRIDWIQ